MSITLIIYTIIGFIITLSPFNAIFGVIQKIITLVYTLVHEFAHAILVLVTSGEIEAMELHYDGSGFVTHEYDDPIPAILCSFAGYSLPCLMSFGFYVLIDMGHGSIVMISLIAIATLSFIFIRNWYGFFWLASFICLLVFINTNGSTNLIEHISMFLSSIIFAGSVYGGWRIFIASFKQPDDAGDATNLFELTYFPSQIWGLIFLAISLCTLVIIPIYFYYGSSAILTLVNP